MLITDKIQLLKHLQGLLRNIGGRPEQIALSWTMNKRPWIIPILGTCHLCRLKENAGAADVHMTDEKVKEIDIELEMMEMSEVFGGSNIKNNYSIVELLKNVNAMAL